MSASTFYCLAVNMRRVVPNNRPNSRNKPAVRTPPRDPALVAIGTGPAVPGIPT
jgi:hypothetical protein